MCGQFLIFEYVRVPGERNRGSQVYLGPGENEPILCFSLVNHRIYESLTATWLPDSLELYALMSAGGFDFRIGQSVQACMGSVLWR